jgi:hypothetical protein
LARGARSARVVVGGRRVGVAQRGRRLTALVDLNGRPGGRVTVRIHMTLRSGGTVTQVRRYRTCAGTTPG